MRGSIFVQLRGRSDRKWKTLIRYKSTYYCRRNDFKSFPWLPVSFEKYGALFGAIALSLPSTVLFSTILWYSFKLNPVFLEVSDFARL